jgi:hypothetical protein
MKSQPSDPNSPENRESLLVETAQFLKETDARVNALSMVLQALIGEIASASPDRFAGLRKHCLDHADGFLGRATETLGPHPDGALWHATYVGAVEKVFSHVSEQRPRRDA